MKRTARIQICWIKMSNEFRKENLQWKTHLFTNKINVVKIHPSIRIAFAISWNWWMKEKKNRSIFRFILINHVIIFRAINASMTTLSVYTCFFRSIIQSNYVVTVCKTWKSPASKVLFKLPKKRKKKSKRKTVLINNEITIIHLFNDCSRSEGRNL